MARLLPLLLLMLAAAGGQAANSSVPDSTEVKDKDGSKGNTEEGAGKGSGVIGKQLAARHLDLMLANYDRHLSPANAEFPPRPTNIYFSLQLTDFHDVNIVEGTFSISCVLQLRFSDLRLKFTHAQAGVNRYFFTGSDMNALWKPSFYISRAVSIVEVTPIYTVLVSEEFTPGDGLNVRVQAAYSYVLATVFNVLWFPFDIQQFTLKYGSEHDRTEIETLFSHRHNGGPIYVPDKMSAGGLQCIGRNASECVAYNIKQRDYGVNGQFTRLFFHIRMARGVYNYLMTWLLPMNVIWVISYTTYFQDPQGAGGRETITITAFLAMIFYQMEVRHDLPKVPYPCFIEMYLFFYTFIVGVSSIEYVVVVINFRDDAAYDKLLDFFKKHGGNKAARASEEELNALIEQDRPMDGGQKKFAVRMDLFFRGIVPFITVLLNTVFFTACFLDREAAATRL